jgi:hypothetical protein
MDFDRERRYAAEYNQTPHHKTSVPKESVDHERLLLVYRETEVERADLETIIADQMSGQFNDPTRVVAFNTLEHWSEDVTEYIAFEIQTRCDIEWRAASSTI